MGCSDFLVREMQESRVICLHCDVVVLGNSSLPELPEFIGLEIEASTLLLLAMSGGAGVCLRRWQSSVECSLCFYAKVFSTTRSSASRSTIAKSKNAIRTSKHKSTHKGVAQDEAAIKLSDKEEEGQAGDLGEDKG